MFAFFCCIAGLSIYNSFANIKSISDEYFESMSGLTGTKGKLLKALKEEKAKERLNTSNPVCPVDMELAKKAAELKASKKDVVR